MSCDAIHGTDCIGFNNNCCLINLYNVYYTDSDNQEQVDMIAGFSEDEALQRFNEIEPSDKKLIKIEKIWN